MSKGLEALEQLSKLVFVHGGAEQYRLIEKELKALEIIKEIDKTSLSFFIAICVKDQDKYDFLKEVLM